MECLSQDSYNTSSLQMEALSTRNDLSGYVNGECEKPQVLANDNVSQVAYTRA